MVELKTLGRMEAMTLDKAGTLRFQNFSFNKLATQHNSECVHRTNKLRRAVAPTHRFWDR